MVKTLFLWIVLILSLVAPTNAGVIFSDNFDSYPTMYSSQVTAPTGWGGGSSGGWYSTGSATRDGTTHTTAEITAPGRGGVGKSMKLWRHGSTFLGFHGLLKELGYQHKDLYVRWYMKVPSAAGGTYNITNNMWYHKFAQFWIRDVAGNAKMVYLDWLGGTFLTSSINVAISSTSDQNWKYIMNTAPTADGQWHCYEMHCKLNTPGSSNGSFEFWFDGVLKYSWFNLNYNATANDYIFAIPCFTGNIWYQNEGAPAAGAGVFLPHWAAVEMDDFIISTTYIGTTYVSPYVSPTPLPPGDTPPPASPPPAPPPPAPPKGVKIIQ